MSEKRSFTKSLFVGIWHTINFSRKLVLNLLFLIIVIFVFVAMGSSSSDKPTVDDNSALVLNLVGRLVIEETWVDPLEEVINEALGQSDDNPEILVRDLVKVIENAAQDDRIKALVLKLDAFAGGGMDKIIEVGEAIDYFKESGKPVYSIGDYYGRAQYQLAAYADNVYLHPMGLLLMEGYTRYGTYFKDLLDNLKITTHVFKVGKFKSAVEPFTRNDMSEEAKLANEAWLNALWQMFKEDVSQSREFDQSNFDETFDTLLEKFAAVEGDFGQFALSHSWVDGLRTRDEFTQEMLELLDGDLDDKTYSQVSYNTYLNIISPSGLYMPTTASEQIAIVVAKGTIMDGRQDPGAIGGDSTAEYLRKARLNDKVKAVVLQVDSGGGSAFASEVIRREIDLLKDSGKPVVASMNSVAASGGYWISVSADRIFAEPSTITGSIGIFGLMATFENTLDYVGIHTDGISTSELNGLSSGRPLADGYKSLIQMNIEKGYQRFISLVAEERGMTIEEVHEVAQGRVWVGTQALEIGLVDELGGLDEAVEHAASLAELDTYQTVYIERELTEDELMWKNLLENASAVLPSINVKSNNNALLEIAEKIAKQTSFIDGLNDPMSSYVLCLECKLID